MSFGSDVAGSSCFLGFLLLNSLRFGFYRPFSKDIVNKYDSMDGY